MTSNVAPEVTLRQFTPADLPAVRWLHDRTPPASQVASSPQPWPEALERIPELFSGFWLAFERSGDAEHLVGMAGLEEARADGAAMLPPPPFIDVSRRLARIDCVRVAPERQRRGIGRALTLAAVRAAREGGYDAVILDTTAQQEAAVALYTSLGFVEQGRTRHEQWEIVWFEQGLTAASGRQVLG